MRSVSAPAIWRAGVLTRVREKVPFRPPLTALALSLAVGALLAVGLFDLPEVGAAGSPALEHVAPRYLNDARIETGATNATAAVVGAYRGINSLLATVLVGVAVAVGGLVAVPVVAPAALRSRRRSESSVAAPRFWHRLEPWRDRVDAVLAGAAPTKLARFLLVLAFPLLSLLAVVAAWSHVDGAGGALAAGAIAAAGLVALATATRLSLGGSAMLRAVAGSSVLFALAVAHAPLMEGAGLLDFAGFGEDFADGQRLGIRLLTTGLAFAIIAWLAGHLVTIEQKSRP